RLAAGKTQVDLAGQSGMTQTAVSVLERGGANPTLKTLERIADALGKNLVITFE
ncbi:helix-turn-helix domain-containing protein, partial [Collinsella tanakaei]